MRVDLMEAAINAIVGFVISLAVTFWVFPLWGLQPSAADSVGITAMFFGVSIARAFVLRRLFRRIGNADYAR